jgi:TonB family protein
MFRLTFVTALLIATFLASPLLAQQKKTAYGPVVTAYLTGLNEELNELNFQLKQKEIGRAEYNRTRQRLLILRRLVQARVNASRTDRVPELQVLQLDEFGMVGLSQPPEAERLQLGNVFDESWRLIGIEPTKPPFYVFEKVTFASTKAPEQMVERQSQRQFDPREVIETIVVHDPQPYRQLSPQTTRPRTIFQVSGELIEPENAGAVTPPNGLVGPRMLQFYLPEYTEKALEKAITGELVVSAAFRRDGKVREVKVEKGLGAGLNERAVEAVKRASFEPARQGERSIDARAEIVFTFTPGKVNARVRNVSPEEE